jgi:hypothetical protein
MSVGTPPLRPALACRVRPNQAWPSAAPALVHGEVARAGALPACFPLLGTSRCGRRWFARGMSLRVRPMCFRFLIPRSFGRGSGILLELLQPRAWGFRGDGTHAKACFDKRSRGVIVKPASRPVWLLLGLTAVLLAAMTRKAYGCAFPRQTSVAEHRRPAQCWRGSSAAGLQGWCLR